MADRPRPPVPTLDRAALERVLARAAELQGSGSDPAEEFSEQQLIELGREVGLSPQSLRQALAEERTRSEVPESAGGLAAALLGPAAARASRTVPGTMADVMAAIDRWMQQNELLTVKRRFGERTSWERNKDVFVGLKRAMHAGGRDYALSHADEVSATVMTIDESRVHVTLAADFLGHRRRALIGVAGAGVAGAAAGGVMLVLGVMATAAAAPIVALPAIVAVSDRGWRRHMVTRSQLALDQLLDRLEQGELTRAETPSLLGTILGATLTPRRPR